MRFWLWVLVLIVFTPWMVRADENGNAGVNQNTNSAYSRLLKKTGAYTLTMMGDYSGTGSACITSASVSISVDVKTHGAAKTTLSIGPMPLVNDRFQGTTTFNGTICTVSGRVDLPAATDAVQTPVQAITGRLTGTLIDASGKGARLVAVQASSAHGG